MYCIGDFFFIASFSYILPSKFQYLFVNTNLEIGKKLELTIDQ